MLNKWCIKPFGWLAVSVSSILPGGFLALHHPIAPVFAVGILLCGVATGTWRNAIWLALVPALLPILSFAPWTGWHVFDEFDIFLWGTLTGAFGRLALARINPVVHLPPATGVLAGNVPMVIGWLRAMALLTLLSGLFLGFRDANGFQFDWFADYVDSMNSLRIFKAGAVSFLFIPLLRQEIADSQARAQRRVAQGTLAGLAAVVLAVVWERMAFPGLFQFAAPYRTVALFWEMHMGGAAIDAYLVLTAPFAIWALRMSRRRSHWIVAAGFLLMCVYAWLTTFSRGVYVAIAVPLTILCLHSRKAGVFGQIELSTEGADAQGRWRHRANRLLILLILIETSVVFVGSSFLRERMSEADKDWGGRLRHWEQGISLLHGSNDWLWGKGLGRFPANYSQHATADELSGAVHWVAPQTVTPFAHVELRGPATRQELAGLFRLTQRVGGLYPSAEGVSLQIRSSGPVQVQVSLCEKHLLYEGGCRRALIPVDPASGQWQTVNARLSSVPPVHADRYSPRFAELAVSVATAGGVVDIRSIALEGDCAACRLQNADFSDGMAHWSYSGKSYFLPWHIDNLYLELLIEQGVVGLVIFCSMIATAIVCLLSGSARSQPLSAYVATSIAAVALLGLVVSVLDMPRVAFLLWLLVHFAHESRLRVR